MKSMILGTEQAIIQNNRIIRFGLRYLGVFFPGVRLRLYYLLRELKKANIDLNVSHILDAGCGRGEYSFSLAKKYPDAQIVGVDISQRHISNCVKIKRQLGLANINFVKEDLISLNYQDKFDLCITFNVLTYIKHDIKALCKMYDSLKTGGLLVVQVPGGSHVRSEASSKGRKRRKKTDVETVTDDRQGRNGYSNIELEEKVSTSGFLIKKLFNPTSVFGRLARYLFSLSEHNYVMLAIFYPFLMLLVLLEKFNYNLKLLPRRSLIFLIAEKPKR